MIPRNTASRLETTLVSYTRQRLPRPARLYSTPSKKTNAPATAFAQLQVPHPDTFGFTTQKDPLTQEGISFVNDMRGFLHRRIPYTILPTPLPDRSNPTALSTYFFPDSPTQDQLAVMDACLHNLYDVPRAKQIFERLRKSVPAESLLETRIYNSFLEAYIEMASIKEPNDRALWVEEAWLLYEAMENGSENIHPTAQTYAIMLLARLRLSPDPNDSTSAPSPGKLLSRLTTRGMSVQDVISDRVFTSSEEASEVIRLLSKAAIEMNMSRVIAELGQVEAMGTGRLDPLDGVPEVTPVKKLADISREIVDENGNVIHSAPVEEIPFNLDNLRKHLAQVTLARRVLPEDVAARQKLLEASVYDVAVERLKHEAKIFDGIGLGHVDVGLRRADLQRWMWDWHQKLRVRLETEIADIIAVEAKQTRDKSTRLGPFLSLVKPETLSLITILEVMRLNSTGGIADGMKLARALLTVGRAVENEYKAQMCKRNNIAIPSLHRVGDHSFFTGLGYRDLHARRVTAAKYIQDNEEWTTEWTQLLRVRVGSILVDCLMDVATVERTALDKRTGEELKERQPAFYHAYEYVRGQKLGVIRLNPVVADRLAKDPLRETLHPRHLPMLVKPKPWLAPDQGGYIYNKTSAMRFKDCQEQQSYLHHASSLGNLELVYAGLDFGTPGERLCKIPPAVYDKSEPEKPENYDTDVQAKSVYSQRLKGYVQDKASNHSERCSVNYKIEISRAFLGDTFYLPHNLDFRGRAYPIPPHLSHIGDDLARGLLMFAEAKPLGERGLRWLKIHLANLYGFDKGNFDERVAFVMNHLDDGQRWWTKADDPWQCLATCMELRAALESGDPHAYMSTLPVHQDGTCNGLQHYAALGGDGKGAAQVNLAVTDRPSDVYTYVANMVEKTVQRDADNGEKIAQLLLGKISRKVVKQTVCALHSSFLELLDIDRWSVLKVMTTVYGVTYIGARDQIERQLKDRGDIPEEHCWAASAYLAKNVLRCIGDLFSGAKAIQNWFNLCAKLITKGVPKERLPEILKPQRANAKADTVEARIRKEQMATVVWTTPLGLPIVQPYRKAKRKQIMTSLQTVYISDPTAPAAVNGIKQASAFPPNFIHSLDATHMMLTALECRTQGITFASVHDSYWTHASSIDQMSGVIRDTFIALHSSDILRKLEAEFRERYVNHFVPLSVIRKETTLKMLLAAGCRISASKDVAAELKQENAAVGNLLDVTDAEASSISTITMDDDAVLVTTDEPVAPTKRARGRPRGTSQKHIQVERDDEESEEENDDDDDVPAAFKNKFIKLSHLIPPHPEKGTFEVETIRKSLYFFS
ncbi:DNA/RNA polymerase [Lanmaoa asiatica]|nr:DNA/RNA polymerase [Lanmaoa asiatica]